jgi:hypothetical protein
MKNYDIHHTDQSFNYFITNAERVSGSQVDANIFMGNRLPAKYPYFICKVNEYCCNSYSGNLYRILLLTCEDLMVSSYHNCPGWSNYDIVVDGRRYHYSTSPAQSTETTSYFIVKNWNNRTLNWKLMRSDNFGVAGTFGGANRAWSLSIMMTPLTSDRELVGRPIISMGQYNTFTMSIGGTTIDQVITIPKIDLPYTYYFVDCTCSIFDNTNLLNDISGSEHFLLIAHDWFMSGDNSFIPTANVLTMMTYIPNTSMLY